MLFVAPLTVCAHQLVCDCRLSTSHCAASPLKVQIRMHRPSVCPRESGFCVTSSGGGQNSGVLKIDSVDGDTPAAQAECLAACHARADATGCEVIWNQYNRGCYIHTEPIDKGNHAANHYCWVFSKCSAATEEKWPRASVSASGNALCGVRNHWVFTRDVGPLAESHSDQGVVLRLYPEAVSWEDARLQCEGHGGALASILNSGQNQELHSVAGGRSVWFASDLNYTNWGLGEPTPWMTCHAMFPDGEQTARWNADDCANRHAFVCQFASSDVSYASLHFPLLTNLVDTASQVEASCAAGGASCPYISEGAATFDGVDDALRVPTFSFGGAMSLAFWVRPTSFAPGTVSAAAWTACAREHQQCSFSGTKNVRYGKRGQYTEQIHTDGVSCSNGVFGDPLVGVVKVCEIQDTVPPAMIDWGSGEAEDNVRVAQLGDNGGLEFSVYRGSTSRSVKVARFFKLNTWVHVAVSVNGTEMRVYRNGMVIATEKENGWEPETRLRSGLFIGQGHGQGLLRGQMKEVVFMSGEHSAVEMAGAPNSTGCWMRTPSGCPKRQLANVLWQRDMWGEERENAAKDETVCMVLRKGQIDAMCGCSDTEMLFIAPPGVAQPPSVLLPAALGATAYGFSITECSLDCAEYIVFKISNLDPEIAFQWGTHPEVLFGATPSQHVSTQLAGALSTRYRHPPEMSCKAGGTWSRPFGDVATTEEGVKECASRCREHAYFGLECPMQAKVHCQCANSLAGSRPLEEAQCNARNHAATTHCVGPYTAGSYHLGSHGTGSVYTTAAVLTVITRVPPAEQPGAVNITMAATGSGGVARVVVSHPFQYVNSARCRSFMPNSASSAGSEPIAVMVEHLPLDTSSSLTVRYGLHSVEAKVTSWDEHAAVVRFQTPFVESNQDQMVSIVVRVNGSAGEGTREYACPGQFKVRGFTPRFQSLSPSNIATGESAVMSIKFANLHIQPCSSGWWVRASCQARVYFGTQLTAGDSSLSVVGQGEVKSIIVLNGVGSITLQTPAFSSAGTLAVLLDAGSLGHHYVCVPGSGVDCSVQEPLSFTVKDARMPSVKAMGALRGSVLGA